MINARLDRQSGVALITVLLVMVIAIAAVTHAVTRNRIAISRTGAILASTQLAEFVNGAEVWARVALENDFEADKNEPPATDSPSDAWAQALLEFKPDNGKIRIYIKDLHACFNVNNLTVAQGAQAQTDIFRRLVQDLTGKPEVAIAIQDWLDTGDTPLTAGTEDDGYLGRELPHRTPDTAITDVSELAAVEAMEVEDWQKLRPFLCALPETGTAINVNFAPIELLKAVYPQSDAEALVSSRESGTVFSERSQLAQFGMANAGSELDFRSAFFSAHIAVQLGEGEEYRQYWESVLARDQTSGRVSVLQRQRREFSGEFLRELLAN
jgi:general secretion pathway protein K